MEPEPDTTTTPAHARGIECADFVPPLPPPVDFRTNPGGWIAENIGNERLGYRMDPESITQAFGALSTLLEPYGSNSDAVRADAVPLAALLSKALSLLEYHTREDSRFVRFGGLLLPTTPAALGVLRTLRTIAAERIHGNGIVGTVEPDSALGVLLAAIASAERERRSPLLLRARNLTDATPGQGFRIGFDFHARAMGAIPRGETLPVSLLSPDPVGFYVEDPATMRDECDMCDSGTVQFLERFGIGFERSGGSYECDSCGQECEGEDGGEIESIDPFTISADMWDAIQRQGFGDAVLEYVGGTSETDSLSALLSNESETETLARVAPDAERGIRFDSDVWRFDPDFESMEGAGEIEGAEALRAGALLSRIVAAHESAGVLPPIPGVLTYRPLPYESNRIGDGLTSTHPPSIAFAWNPTAGTLETGLGGGLLLRIDARKGDTTLAVRDGRTVPLGAGAGEWIADARHESGGESAALLLRIAKGRAEI